MGRKISAPRVTFQIINYSILLITGLLCLLPFINLLAISFSNSAPVAAGRVFFWPVDFSISSYQFALSNGKFLTAFLVSIKRILLGVGINLVLMVTAAYPLSKNRDKFRARNIYMVYFVITMLINGGLIPTYLLMTKLRLINTIWALVLPWAQPVGTMVILMNFIRQMPQDIEEAAMIDGAGVFKRLVSVMLPLLTPALATVGLFCIVGHWNDYLMGIIYMHDPKLYPLQSYLQTMLRSIDDIIKSSGSNVLGIIAQVNARTGRAAQLFLGTLPMLLIYPFLQKYFTSGLVIGSVKG